MPVAYLLYGSRAGSALLRREWEKSTDFHVRMAQAFFFLPSTGAAWTHLRDGLGSMPADDARADAIVASAQAAFDVFIAEAGAGAGAEAGAATPDSSGADTSEFLSGSGMVVEDDAIIALDTAEILQSMGADEVHCAASVKQAQLIMDRTDIAFAVLDINLRGETSAALAHLLHRARVPYVLASGDGGNGQGIDGYPDSIVVSKPYDVETLRRGLLNALGGIRNLAATPTT